jgi:hypothetical protein
MLRVPYFDAADFGAKLQEAIDYRSMFPTLRFIRSSTDITNTSGIFEQRGDTPKAWAKRFEELLAAA